ncbi:MAG TPA: glycerophosphodiester phosphodiesterase family protein [Methylomirabilota bacterium]|nr:glycerophosphodiester phosphodiesterase family protein [Methylomirabilota bacterium]
MKGPLLLALGLVAAGAVVGSVTAAAQGMIAPLFAAHRGGALLWAENSLLAFRNALALGADFLELDVHLTRDGEVVVIHDATLERTTTGTGPVRERTLAELGALRPKDRDGAVIEEGIPTLDQVVALAAAGKRQILLEIKTDERRRRYPEIEEKVFAVLDRHRFTPFTVVMAFEGATWRRLRELRPDARVAALYSARMLPAARVTAELEALRRAGVAFVGLEQALVGADVARQARLAGLTLGVWTVNEREAIARFIDQGVGVVITDRPDLAKELLGR